MSLCPAAPAPASAAHCRRSGWAPTAAALATALAAAAVLALPGPARAQATPAAAPSAAPAKGAQAERKGRPTPARRGKLRLTGGVGSIEGAAGGGIVPWALIGTYANGNGLGISSHLSRVSTRDYGLTAYGAAIGYGDRAELSIGRQVFDTGGTGAALGVPGAQLKQNILGLKLRVAGEAILDSDRWLPQTSIGLQIKELDAGGLAGTLQALGARRSGIDAYVSASKLFLAQGLLVNGTLRATRANQGGLLGFGATGQRRYRLVPEIAVAWLLRPDLAIGFEYRDKPDNLNPGPLGNGLREDAWKDVFVAWAPNKNFSLTAAYVDLGVIVPAVVPRRQTGGYVSAQVSY